MTKERFQQDKEIEGNVFYMLYLADTVNNKR